MYSVNSQPLPNDDGVLAFVTRHFLEKGIFPKLSKIANVLGLTIKETTQTLRTWERKGVIILGPRLNVRGAGGLSREKTMHFFLKDGRRVFVWCAMDALGIPLSAGVSTTVHSQCAQCKSPIRIGIKPPKIVNYDDNIQFFAGCRITKGKTIEDVCPYINFFCSTNHLRKWRSQNKKVTGLSLDLPRASEFSNKYFKRFIG